MSKQSRRLINFEDQNIFRVMAGETFTVPRQVDGTSPLTDNTGLTPSDLFDSVREGAGGMVFAGFVDLPAGGADQAEVSFPVRPGDEVAVAAVAGFLAAVTVNGEQVAVLGDGASTTIAGVLGYFA